MSPVAITLLVIVIVLAIIIAVLYFLGKKAQKKQAEQQELLDACFFCAFLPKKYNTAMIIASTITITNNVIAKIGRAHV